MTRPDLEAIRARNLVDWTGNGEEELSGDVAALLAYVEELEASTAHTTSWTIGETEWAQRIGTLEHMLLEERDTVDKLRKYIDELKAEAASLGDMLDNAHAREDANWFEVNRLKDRIAKLDERALTAEERLEQRTRERDEARQQLAELGTHLSYTMSESDWMQRAIDAERTIEALKARLAELERVRP